MVNAPAGAEDRANTRAPSSARRTRARRLLVGGVGTLVLLAAWLVPRAIAHRARERGPVVGPGVDAAVADRMIQQAELAVGAAREHPLSRAIAPFHRVTSVWRAPGHCAPDEPGGSDRDREYGASVRSIGWFGIPGGTITVRCGGAAWHVGRSAASGGATESADARQPSTPPVVQTRHGLMVERYEVALRVVGGDVVGDIPFAYRNTRDVPLLVPGCNGPNPPMMQWWTGATWESAYRAVSPACSGPPLVLQPGTRFRDTVRVQVARDSIDARRGFVEPHWRAPRTATVFRLVWAVYEQAPDTRAVRVGPLVPEAERASAPFRSGLGPR